MAKSCLTTATAANLPCWPALLYQPGADELLYLDDLPQWQALHAEAAHLLRDDDRIIDSLGQQFAPTSASSIPRPLTSPIAMAEFQQLIARHGLSLGQCCLAKMQLKTVADGIQFVKSLR